MTLLQLNRHLDDSHQELPEVEQDEVKNWFEKQVVKAKKFQPLAVINQKLKGLDVFESNASPVLAPSYPNVSSGTRSPVPEVVRQADPDEIVTRTHWQKQGYNDVCTDPTCGKRLGATNGSVNCRKCGRLFCEEHTMYQIKLSRSAQHEPVRGVWCRVCETCYKSREGYNDHDGKIRDHTKSFTEMRRKHTDKQYLEMSRLEKRLTKLTQLLAHPPEPPETGGTGLLGSLSSLSGHKSRRQELEQSVVTWEEDGKVSKCPFCQQEFGWSFRKHHCRICGRVVCADIRTACSTDIGLNVAVNGPSERSETNTKTISVDVRMCRDCRSTIFARKDFQAELEQKPPDQRAYENLLQFEKGIRLLLASFQRSLLTLQDPHKPPSHEQLAEASKVRKRLIDSFGKYDLLAKRIRDLPSPSGSTSQQKLQKAIYQQASGFLHLHMLPLKSLPKSLRHASPHGHGLNGHKGAGGGTASPLRPNGLSRLNDVYESSSQISASSSLVSAMETEEKELRERLIVLEEQRFFVRQMVEQAKKARRYDEVTALNGNLEDLGKEIDSVSGVLAGMDWEGVYAGNEAGGGGR
jgi:hypothetical protein